MFKNLKLRNIIYKIWYFFLYKFDYVDYNNKHQALINNSFNFIYYTLYINFFILTKINMAFEKTKNVINKIQLLNQSKDFLTFTQLNNFLRLNTICLTKKFQELDINEI